MKSTLNRVIAVVVLALVSLLITGLALAQTEWSLAVDPGPGAVDLMVQPELTITVTVSATADNALVLCSVQTGQVQAMSPGVYPLSHNGAIWSGDLTGDEPRSFTFTIRPGSWPETEVPCVVIDYGAVRQAVTATVQVEPFRFHLPVIAGNHSGPVPEPTGVHTWTYAAGSWPIVAVGSTWAEVMASPTFNFWRYDLRSTVQNMPPAINGSRYILGRGQVAFDTSRLPAGQIISAWLELCVPMIPQNEMDVTFHAGTWPYPPVTADWFAYEAEPLGVYNTGQWTTATVFITVPLPGLVGQPRSDLVKLTLRGDETTEYPRGALDYPSVMFAWQWVWDGVTYEPASKLHLIIAEPNP